MTEFETAMIALRHASLQATYIQTGVAALVGLIQCALLAYGLQMMKAGNADRAEQTQLLSTALEQQGPLLQQQGTLLQQQGALLADIGEGIREQSTALRELLRRRDAD